MHMNFNRVDFQALVSELGFLYVSYALVEDRAFSGVYIETNVP